MDKFITVRLIALACLGALFSPQVRAQDYDQDPIRYSQTEPANRVSNLMERIRAGKTRLEFESSFGYLRSLLKELQIPESSQTLVFSKTSLQRERISPRTPRALYFSDDVYVGYCQQGGLLEVTALDPQLGAVFYTVQQDQAARSPFVRQGDNCLICHASGHTKDVPGLLVRSVHVDGSGFPILSAGTYRVDHTTPLANRWGGWYVTGTHGDQKHMGNLIVHDGREPELLNVSEGMNLTDLVSRFDTSAYLSGDSDLVALMVLEHQAGTQNLITRANFQTRQALYYQAALNRELNEPADRVWDSTKSRIKSACEPLVDSLLLCGEPALTHPVRGTSGFAEEFARRGPFDRQGRSLREFDLKARLFRFPCSYLIYSNSFQALPGEARDYVWSRMGEILRGEDQSPKFRHLTAEDRRAILEILQGTLPDFPESALRRVDVAPR